MMEKIGLTAEAKVWQETTPLVDRLNRTLRGWANYFRVGTVTKAYRPIARYTTMRLGRNRQTEPTATAPRADSTDCGQ